MPTISPSTPTAVSPDPVPAAVLATGNLGTRTTLDLRGKVGFWVYRMIGRRTATALTRSARINIRTTYNDTMVHPAQAADAVSAIAAVSATTVGSNTTIGATTFTVASASGFAIGDTVCLSDSGGARIEFCRIANISGTTFTVDEPLKAAHNSGDAVTNGADVWDRVFLEGGDVYSFRAENISGQDVVVCCRAQTYDSDNY